MSLNSSTPDTRKFHLKFHQFKILTLLSIIFISEKLLIRVRNRKNSRFCDLILLLNYGYIQKASSYVFFIILLIGFFSTNSVAQHSVARKWNDVLLQAIREDYARPTVHARNLFHTSIALYDMWSVYEETASTYYLGKKLGNSNCFFGGISKPPDIQKAQEEAMSFAAYRLLNYRFYNSPGSSKSLGRFDSLFTALGYNPEFISIDYSSNVPAALGNYMADCLISFGLQDGSNETNNFTNIYYKSTNPPLAPANSGNPGILHPNNWQPLTLDTFIDQSGNEIPFDTPEFLSPEWGNVIPFALSSDDLTIYERDGKDYYVYHDPGSPPRTGIDSYLSEEYKWNFSLVSIWGAHLDTQDSIIWDISPASIGNISDYPSTLQELRDFYPLFEGGDPSNGYNLNPVTGLPYEPQYVPRGDYARVLAEFWADGPDSETPPGHWFTILNYVSDHSELEKKYKGIGPILDDIEWDVKSYLVLGGAVHDAAIAAWGIKGWYDYIRPISAIRYMADMGQCSDSTKANYNAEGIPLIEGYIELINENDPLAGQMDEHLGKIKLYTWRGPDYIDNPEIDMAGVGWIRAENWWPYQRPTFVTPPFAGYVSGHSTYSRASAEVLTLLTGNSFFPGGLGEFEVKKNDFLVFEEGPSINFKLQWATYRDASDQTSLSRIWGGIHPPVDDIPGRLIGEKIGIAAFALADDLFQNKVNGLINDSDISGDLGFVVFPIPAKSGNSITIQFNKNHNKGAFELVDLTGKSMWFNEVTIHNGRVSLPTIGLSEGVYILKIETDSASGLSKIVIR